MIRRHFDGIVAWTQTRQTNGFIVEAGRSSIGAAMPMWKVRDIQRRPSPTTRVS
jgi:hypothetical protein